MTVGFCSEMSLSLSMVFLARISLMMLIRVFAMAMKIKRRFLYEPTMSTMMARTRLTRLKIVRVFLRMIFGMVFCCFLGAWLTLPARIFAATSCSDRPFMK